MDTSLITKRTCRPGTDLERCRIAWWETTLQVGKRIDQVTCGTVTSVCELHLPWSGRPT